MITGLTKGGSEWTPQFATELDQAKCIGCGRCYKVCSRDVFDLKEKSEVLGDDFDDEDQDDVAMVMTVSDADDCIGCGACSRVCPKNCHSYS